MGFWAKFMGPEPTIQEILPVPPGMFDHKDHLSLCQECKRHYLCREYVCRIVCATCGSVSNTWSST